MSLDVTTLALAKSYTNQHGGGGGQVQSDWSQNDETAKDYVKNRPFYTGDPVETVLVEESTVSFSDTGDGLYGANFLSTIEATVGETYKVYWDGTVYECTCVDFSGNNMIGNLSIADFGSDTGEPFIMQVVNGRGIIIATKDTSASHTFSISGFAQEVVKIDEKYLPDTVATKSEVETAQATANKAQTTAHNAQTTANKAVKPSKQLEDGCSYFMYNPYSDYKSTNVLIGTSGGTSLTIEVNKEQYPSVAFVPPVYGANQADFEFRRVAAEYPHPLITGIGGIVVYSSTPKSTKKFRITVDDDYNVSATNTSDSVSKALATTEYVDNSVSNPLNITSAAVGQIAKITAVDDSGKPTDWEAVDMPTGADGVTPHIRDNGNWYIGSTDTGKPSRGTAGAPGKTPVRGTDYWTAADKQEIVNSVIAALPDGTEVSY